MQQLGRRAGVPSTLGVEVTQPTVGGMAGCGIETSLIFPIVCECHRVLRK